MTLPSLEDLAAVDNRLALAAFVAAIDLWSVGLLLRSEGSRREKALWTVVILLCPIVGCVLWYVLGPKPRLVPPEATEGRG